PQKEKTESKKCKNTRVQVEALSKQKMCHLDVQVHDSKGTSGFDPVSSNSKGKVLKSQRQSSTRVGKTKMDALRQGSAKQKRDTSRKPEAEELMLSWPGLETNASDAEQCERRLMPSEDSPMPSPRHQQERTVSLKKNLKSSKHLQSASKASQHLVPKKQTSKQKLSKDTVAKRLAESPRKKSKKSVTKGSNKKPQLQREESSDSETGEEVFEREPVQLDEVFTSPLRRKSETSVVQKLDKSVKHKNLLPTLESLGGANSATPVKALQHLPGSVQRSERKRSAKSSGKISKKVNHRISDSICSNSEDTSDTENPMDCNSSSVQHGARKKQKLSDVEIKSNKRKHNKKGLVGALTLGLLLGSPLVASSGYTGEKSGIVNARCGCLNVFSDNSEDWSYMKELLLNKIAKHKIVMPSNSPNVRRTKRIRLRPLEYWRGERVNYTMKPSG
ncbi:CENPC protein, partial [Syrrhaptes paradoxus]|nr:CENPC protein [Syrrhaptes paradoxus]